MAVKVSVIVPVYNVERYLKEAMKSIVSQTLKELEIVCINDGSTDGSSEILREFAKSDARVRVIDKENEGYGAAVNLGIEQAEGEYIGIVEPDDWIACDMYEELYRVAKENALDFVKADFYSFETELNGDMNFYYRHLSGAAKDYNTVFHPMTIQEHWTIL